MEMAPIDPIYFHIRWIMLPKEYIVDVYEEKRGTSKVIIRTTKKELSITTYIAATDNIAIKDSFEFVAAECRDRCRVHTYELKKGISIWKPPYEIQDN